MSKKVGILAFHASHNYGSMLLALALQQCLYELGHNPVIINLRSKAQISLYRKPSFLNKPIIKSFIKNLLFYNKFKQNLCKWNLFEHFLEKELVLTDKIYQSYDELEKDLPNLGLDVLLAGGDQIWNQKCRDFDISYLLPFNTDSIKKMSYSPSMGRQVLAMMESPYVDNYVNYLSSFKNLSVREPDAADALSKLLDREVSVNPDPVFLNDVAFYDKLIDSEPIIKQKYLFYYSPQNSMPLFDIVKRYAQSRGLLMVSSNSSIKQSGILSYNCCGPREFLNLLKNAEFVCGRSFHLVVFSLLFHKDFAVLNGDKDPRMTTILYKCGITSRGINLDNPDFSKMEPINFDSIDNIITQMRIDGRNFLSENI